MHAADLPSACENCTSVLQGPHCHVCGQHGANPLRHFGHAVEDVFESFWHLDGRVFRTLRELFVPGRVACNYLAGQRIRYIPPLRLFVILSLLTFFVGRLSIDDDAEPVQVSVGDTAAATAAFEAAATPEAVGDVLRQQVQQLRSSRADVGDLPVVAAAIDSAESAVRARAASRLVALGQSPAQARQSAGINAVAKPRSKMGVLVGKYSSRRLREPGRPWDARTNPVDAAWLPDVGDAWLNKRLANFDRNISGDEMDGRAIALAALSMAPTALFLLMPVFAAMLRLLYIRHRHGVLEHLVVALYSHAFLLVALLCAMALGLLVDAVPAGWAALPGTALGALFVYLPVYLLLMQKRVYGQRWPVTVVKYLLIGGVYFQLVSVASVALVVASLFSGA